MLIHNVAFLCKRLLWIFKDNGRDHIDKGVDRRHKLGGVYFQKTRVEEISIDKGMDKEDVVPIYNGMLLSHKKE